jgi:TonB family protein
MNRFQKTIMSFVGVAFVLLGAVVIFSQQPPGAGPMVYRYEQGPQEPGSAPRTPLPRDDTFNFISGEMSFDGKLVKGAPYSGQAVTEMTQTLSDGNRIVNKTTASLYRDSEGRTRREQSLRTIGAFATANDSPHMIYINDPVAQMNYVLDPRTRTARKMPSFRFEVKVTAPPDAKTTAPNQTSTTNPNNSGNDYVTTTVPSGDGGYRVESFGGGRRTQTQSLGKQLVEGVEAEGMRTTVTIPAGEIGNDRPIEIVNERWYSAELQMVIMTRQSDPRSGEAVYRLTNIDRGEPDKSLFEIPGDYTVKDFPRSFDESGGSVSTTTASTPGAINGGVLNGKTTSMPLPAYPPIARQAHASGPVTVQVLVDEGGNVIEAKAVAGHPLLQAAAVAAARQAKLAPTRLSGQPVKVSGTLIYNFVAQ